MIEMFTTFCPFPNNDKKVLIGDNSGKIFIGNLEDFKEIKFTNGDYQSCLLDYNLYELLYEDESDDLDYMFTWNKSIRNIIKLSTTEIVGHSSYGIVFLLNCKNETPSFEIIREVPSIRKNRMYQIASVNPDNFIISGNWGNFWIFNRRPEGIWDIDEKKRHNNAHFALEVYDQGLEHYVANDYYGITRILDKSCEKISNLRGFNKNLQDMALLPDIIAAVDYFGNSHIYTKSGTDNKKYINIQTIDCDNQTKIYPHIIFHRGYFYACFPNALWRFDPELIKIEKISINCKDINVIKDKIVVLTQDDIVIINSEDFIFLRSKSDSKEKARKEGIENYLEEKGFDKKNLIDVSAKNGSGIKEIIDLLCDPRYWEEKKISTENKIKTQLISAIGLARASKLDKLNLIHINLEEFEDLDPNVLEKFVQKISEEGDLYYISKIKQIILNTENMGDVESFILNLFSESEGLINKKYIQTELEKRFSDQESEELKYYYGEFIKYLT